MTEYRQIIRGTEIELDGFLGLEGMRAYSTDGHNMRVYDGVLMGGYTILNEEQIAALYTLPDRLTVDGKLIVADADTAVEAGFYRVVGTEAHLPVANQGTIWVGASADTADGDVAQIYCRSTGTAMYERVKSNGVWSAWVQIMDKTLADATYLGLHATADNAALLNGQNAAFYTNIVARLGYTPVNKAGDTMLGPLISSGTPTTSLELANKGYIDGLIATQAGLTNEKISWAVAQTLTPSQRLQGRLNAGVSWVGDIAGFDITIPVSSFNITTTPGECMSSYVAGTPIRLREAIGFTKSLANPWASGSGLAGAVDLNTSLPLVGTATYHYYVIGQSAAPFGVDYCSSLSANGPSVGVGSNIPATWDKFRRIGSFNLTAGTGATNGIVTHGDDFLLQIPNLDISMAGTLNAAAATIITLTSLPTGIRVGTLADWACYKAGVSPVLLVTSLDQVDSVAGGSIATARSIVAANAGYTSGIFRTDTLARLRVRSSIIASNLIVDVRGWLDDRGRFGGL